MFVFADRSYCYICWRGSERRYHGHTSRFFRVKESSVSCIVDSWLDPILPVCPSILISKPFQTKVVRFLLNALWSFNHCRYPATLWIFSP